MGEPVMARVSNGVASPDIELPRPDSAWLPQSRLNALLRHRLGSSGPVTSGFVIVWFMPPPFPRGDASCVCLC